MEPNLFLYPGNSVFLPLNLLKRLADEDAPSDRILFDRVS
jgi:hypothetical protein